MDFHGTAKILIQNNKNYSNKHAEIKSSGKDFKDKENLLTTTKFYSKLAMLMKRSQNLKTSITNSVKLFSRQDRVWELFQISD